MTITVCTLGPFDMRIDSVESLERNFNFSENNNNIILILGGLLCESNLPFCIFFIFEILDCARLKFIPMLSQKK